MIFYFLDSQFIYFGNWVCLRLPKKVYKYVLDECIPERNHVVGFYARIRFTHFIHCYNLK